jgi:probable phosphoglycerate mutase
VLVRHGESNVTVQRVIGGNASCTGLSELGRRQAEALRDRFAEHGELGRVDAVVASTMPRAIETAAIVAPALGHLAVDQRHDLREHDPGPECDGMSFATFVERYGPVDETREPYLFEFPGGDALVRLVDEHRGRTVVAFVHGGVIDVAFRALLGLPMVGAFDLWTLNTSVTEFRATRQGRWQLARYNDAAHLAGLPPHTPPTATPTTPSTPSTAQSDAAGRA